MIKIAEITKEQFNKLNKSDKPVDIFKKFINLNTNTKYNFGDTVIKADNANHLDVFKNTFNGRDFYYLIIEPINEELVSAYTFWPSA